MKNNSKKPRSKSDIERTADPDISVQDVLKSLVKNPMQLIFRWNWKSALLGAIMRAFFYFAVYKASNENWVVTTTAVIVELTFRIITSGISGAVIQSFRKAQPVWLSTTIVTVTLPIFSHAVEWITHFGQEQYFSHVFAASENQSRQRAFVVSLFVSALSALFNLFTMRKGVFLVGSDESHSLKSDLKQIPMLVAEFIAFVPHEITLFAIKREYWKSIGIFVAFGATIGLFFGVLTQNFAWGWKAALISWGILIFALLLTVIIKPHWDRYSAGKSNKLEQSSQM